MRYTEGRAWVVGCPRCDHPVFEAHSDGMIARLSTKTVAYRDALVLVKYKRSVWNVWIGQTQIWVTSWFGGKQPPSRGYLLIEHICVARN